MIVDLKPSGILPVSYKVLIEPSADFLDDRVFGLLAPAWAAEHPDPCMRIVVAAGLVNACNLKVGHYFLPPAGFGPGSFTVVAGCF